MAALAYCSLALHLSWKPLNNFGEVSYSAYLSHFAVVQLAEFFFLKAGIDLKTYASFFMGLVFVFVSTWIVSLGLRSMVEKPSSKIGKLFLGMFPDRALELRRELR